MRHFIPLYFKEIKGEQDSIIGLAAITIVLMFIMLSLAIWRPESWIIGLATLPVGLLPLWFVYLSFDMLSREWKEKSIALLSGIPVKGEFLLGAKMGALWTEFLLISLLLTGGLMLIGLAGPGVSLEVGTIDWLKSVTAQFLLLLPVTPIAFLIYLSGASLNRWSVPVRIICAAVLIGLLIAIEKVLALFLTNITINCPWLGLSSHEQYVFSVSVIDLFIPALFLLSLYIIGILSFLAGSRLIEKYILP